MQSYKFCSIMHWWGELTDTRRCGIVIPIYQNKTAMGSSWIPFSRVCAGKAECRVSVSPMNALLSAFPPTQPGGVRAAAPSLTPSTPTLSFSIL